MLETQNTVKIWNKSIWNALSNLVPFVQFKKTWKTPMDKCYLETCNFTKLNTSPWVFFVFFKLFKWYQIAQRITIIFSAEQVVGSLINVFRSIGNSHVFIKAQVSSQWVLRQHSMFIKKKIFKNFLLEVLKTFLYNL